MDRVHKPHNLSAILRNCDAVGVLEAHAVPPEGGLEISAGSSAGASKWVPVRRHRDISTAVTALRASGFRVVAAHPTRGARDYRKIDFTQPTALLVGSELQGLSDGGLDLADELGLMVWQELIYACALYPRDKAFLRLAQREVLQQVALAPLPWLSAWLSP